MLLTRLRLELPDTAASPLTMSLARTSAMATPPVPALADPASGLAVTGRVTVMVAKPVVQVVGEPWVVHSW